MKNKKAFTLVELVIVIAVIAILAAVLLPTFAGILERAKENTALQQATSARNELISSNEEFTSILDIEGYLFSVDNYIYKVENGILSNYSNDIDENDILTNYTPSQIIASNNNVIVYKPIQENVSELTELPFNFTIDEDTKTAILTGYYGELSGQLTIPAYIHGLLETRVQYTYESERPRNLVNIIDENGWLDMEKEYTIAYSEDGETYTDYSTFTIMDDYYSIIMYDLSSYTYLRLAQSVNIYVKGENNYAVKEIYDGAIFSGCTKITKLIIEEGIEIIGSTAFQGCTNLTEVLLPNSLKSMRNSTFYDCPNLKSIIIPEGMESIGNHSFSGTTVLEYIEIPQTLKMFEHNIFSDESIEIFIEKGIVSVLNNVYYLKSGDNKYFIALKFLGEDNLEIVEGCALIARHISYSNRNLTSIILPSTIKYVAYYAFEGCSKIETIYYYGTNKDNIYFYSGNTNLLNAQWVYDTNN